jgi:phage N-6-adenine-methyltransferase
MEKNNHHRKTPLAFFATAAARYGRFTIDLAADASNTLCPVWLGPQSPLGPAYEDALVVDWHRLGEGPVVLGWCNPPYAPPGTIARWVAKAQDEARLGFRCVMLLPADTSTSWYQGLVKHECHEFVPFRLRFNAGSTFEKNTAKFASLLVYFAPPLNQGVIVTIKE